MRYLVTGGCGFIGSHLVDALVARGDEVLILDDLSTGSQRYIPSDVELTIGDVADATVVRRAMEGMDGCFHLAAVASIERGTLDWIGSHRTNVTGAVAVFDAARSANPNKPIPVIYASSATVYGQHPDVLSEDDQRPKPLNAYGADKYGCELHGFVANHIHGVPNCGLRFFNVYGPRQDPNSPYSGVITIFSTRFAAGRSITINGDGYHTRDFIYVADVIRALLAAMQHCAERSGSEVYNVCTGVETAIIDLAEELAIMLKAKSTVTHGPPRPGDPRRLVGCPEKAFRALGFRAQIDLARGLERMISQSAVTVG